MNTAEDIFMKFGDEFHGEQLSPVQKQSLLEDPQLAWMFKAMREYARIQIQKDRIDAANKLSPRAITQDGQKLQMQSIVNRPIQLD